jgi:hypothetical protein
MLTDRLHPLRDDDIIYHYCSSETFVNVIINGTIRFSDANLLNDAEEGRWGYDCFIETANRILKRQEIPDVFPEVTVEFIDRLDAIWFASRLRLASFIACFSSDGDSLSQWRAYADDGMGFSIGFSAKALQNAMPVQILNVLYEREQQIREMAVIIGAAYLEFVEQGSDLEADWLFERAAEFAASAIALKNPAWRDEKEVRCHHVVDVQISEDRWVLTDGGGVVDRKDVTGERVGFQVRKGTIVPILDLPFRRAGEPSPIREIVTGPRCPNAAGNALFLLGSHGYGVVPIRAAGSAYR